MAYNAILIIIDSLRKDHVGAYGGLAQTPNMNSLSKESAVYETAYPESLPTIPVRRGIYTGNRVFPFRPEKLVKGTPWVFNYGWRPLSESDEDTSISEVFKAKGYRTALIGDNYHLFEPGMNFNRGFDEWIFIRGQEFDKFRSARLVSEEEVSKHLTPAMRGSGVERLLTRYLSNVKFRQSEEDWFPALTFREASRWLAENRDAEKFLLVIEVFDPHEPWDPPKEFVDAYDPGYSGIEVITPKYGPSNYLSPAELRHMRALYAGEVSLVDKWLGYFLTKFYELNLDKNTVLALVSDHGHQLGEHGLTGKVAFGLYPELVDIPLMIRHPEGVAAGTRVKGYVYNHDLFTTLTTLAGATANKPVDGINAWELAEGKTENQRDHVTSAFMNYFMYRDDENWLIVDRAGNNAKLYSIKGDPKLEKNIANEQPDVVKDLYARIVAEAGGKIPEMSAPPESALKWYDAMYG